MLEGVGCPSVLLFAQPTVRNIFLVKLHLILSCSCETFLQTFTYSQEPQRLMLISLRAHPKKGGMGQVPSIQGNKTWAGTHSLQWSGNWTWHAFLQGQEKPQGDCNRISHGNNGLCELALSSTAVLLRTGECHNVTYGERKGQPAGANSLSAEPVFALSS